MRSLVLLVVAVACAAPEHGKPTHAPPPLPAAAAPGLRLPDTVTPLSYALTLDVDPDRETFRGDVRIRIRIDKPTDRVWLHMVDLDLVAARYDTTDLEVLTIPGDQMRAFGFGRTLAPREVELAFTYVGHATRDQEGLFRQRTGGRSYMFSQGQAVFARRITPCFDEPRFKTPWRVTLITPRDQVVLSNTAEQRVEAVDADHKRVTFAETRLMPSYLLAVAVGPFDLVDAGTVGKHKIPVRVAIHAGAGKQASVVADRLPAIVTALEAYTDDALPLAKLDLVGVPHLFGAMENPGLITFDESMLLGPARKKPLANVFTQVAAHELAHQWFGNLVTPAWWDDLWLSESFASWLGDKVARELGAIDNPALERARARREALDADAGADAIPLRHPIVGNEDPDEAFDSIAYAKGEVVLATFEAWLGDERLRDTLRGYLRAHHDSTATTHDLVAAIGQLDPAGGTAFEQYATTIGAPVVDFELRCDGKPVLIASARDQRLVPVCVRYAGAPRPSCALVGERTELALGSTCPAWVLGNAGAGYYHVAWSTRPPRGPAPRLEQLDAAARLVAGDDLAAAVLRGELAAKPALAQLRALADSRDVYAQLGAIAIAKAIDGFVDEPTRAAWTAWIAARFADRLTNRGKTRSERDLIDAVSEVVPPERFPAWLVDNAFRAVDALIRDDRPPMPDVLALAAAKDGAALFDRLVLEARSTRDDKASRYWLELLGQFPGAFAEPTAALAVDKAELPIEPIWSALDTYFARTSTRSAAWRALRPRLATFVSRMPEHTAELVTATGGLCTMPERAEVAAAFAPHLPHITDGRAKLAHALAAIDRCIARRAQLGDLAAALAAPR